MDGGVIAFHCAELIYTFHNVDIPVVTRATGGDETAHKVQDEVAGAWVSFARTGSPSQDNLEWKPYTEEEKNVMVFDTESVCRVIGDETLCDLMLGNH
ncbi:MAG: carboxylesterase family protein [Robinsoniella sp.]|nr:carboxylesterase family protein [Robinsoniella sp.]